MRLIPRRCIAAVGLAVLLAMPLQSCATGKTWDWIWYAGKGGFLHHGHVVVSCAVLWIPAALATAFAFDIVAFPFQIARCD